ncbi:MAG: DoxX family protein [Muribaculaceae bacterium]|nr:DoxX family protein [Muribaculaceae bacterium]
MPVWKRLTVWILRLVVGGVFVMSGLVKMIDLWGFVFKIEEYLAIWNLSQPRTIVFIVAMGISGYEFVLGSLLAMGCYKRVAPWGLLLTMAAMLPLTLYVWLADPVSDCGCFGDFWKISNAATFFKNVVITGALLLLLKWNGRLRESLFNPAIQWMVGAWISLYIIIIGLYGYNAQPMADFRSFPVGTSLLPSDADGDAGFAFIYEKDGRKEEFSIDNLPDSTWTFVDRVSTGSAAKEDEHAELAVFDGEDDVTADVIEPEGEQLLLVVSEPRRAGVTFTYTINEIYEYADSIGLPMIALLGTDSKGVAIWRDMSMAEYPCYTADDTLLKELARGSISLVMLDNGVITSKTTLGSISPGEVESPAGEAEFKAELKGYGARWFTLVNVVFGGALLALYLFQGIILAIRIKIKQAYRRKAAKIS